MIVRGGAPEIPPGLFELIENVIQIDNAIQVGLTVPFYELTVFEFSALLAYRRSRAAYEEQLQKQASSRRS